MGLGVGLGVGLGMGLGVGLGVDVHTIVADCPAANSPMAQMYSAESPSAMLSAYLVRV